MKIANKGKVLRAAFAIEPRFDETAALNAPEESPSE
jgi:hypothetical protein